MRALTRWDEHFSTEETNEILTTLALEICREIPEGAARTAITAGIISRDYSFLCNADLAYEELSVASAIGLRQCLAFFTKRRDLDIGIDKRVTALEKWFKAESACRETNSLFRSWFAGRIQFAPHVESILFSTQRKIAEILGDVPEFSEIKPRFGPGATTQVKKRNASARNKLGQAFACSGDFLGCLAEALEEMPQWVGLSHDGPDSVQVSVEIHTSRLDFVPKNAKTDRAIGVEPMLNSMFQLGIGDFMARRLRRFGVDISDQTKNQRLAMVGSLTGALATLDLESASDTVATGLVASLLPYDWYNLLNKLRSSLTQYGGCTLELQKFSSMGNGFTFPLETLIFYSLAHSCCLAVKGRPPCADEISVYGDDIIVPSDVFPLLTEVLRICGFSANLKKSFASGPFRESCGKDFLSGIDIRPCYVKDALDGPALFVLHNFFKRRGLDDLAQLLLSPLSPHLRIFGPDGYGDGHLLGTWEHKPKRRQAEKPFPASAIPPKDWRSTKYCAGWSGYTFDTFTLKSRRSFKPQPGDGILPCYSVYAANPWEGVRSLGIPQRRGYLRMYDGRLVASRENDVSNLSYNSRGGLGVVLPGSEGYKRISIYTLVP